jgi:hypothetical protein
MALSKSEYMAGRRCHRLLWLQKTEPDAPELVPDVATQVILDHGVQVGEEARRRFPGGVLASPMPWNKPAWKAATAEALSAGDRPVFEAAVEADGGFLAADVLEPDGAGGWRLVEVKGTLETKPEHREDAAFQVHVLRAAGFRVTGTQVMHLNRDCDAADLGKLFQRDDVSLEDVVPQVGARLRELAEVVAGPDPKTPPGKQCKEPTVCPFRARCEIPRPDHHVSELYADRTGLAKKLEEKGITTLDQIPAGEKLTEIQARQVRAAQKKEMVVEAGLAEALRRYEGKRIAFLDFETIAPAIPVWPGCHPLQHVPVQWSVHVLADGKVEHHEHLAEPGPWRDPRPELARNLVAALAGADVVLAYFASFEKAALEHLAANVPEHSEALKDVVGKLEDLLPLVRANVYDPNFQGSFSLKSVAPALVGMSYADMTVHEGMTASALLERMVLGRGGGDGWPDYTTLRKNLLDYCSQDTEALVAVYRRLEYLAMERMAEVRLEAAAREAEALATKLAARQQPSELVSAPGHLVFCDTPTEGLGLAQIRGVAMQTCCLYGAFVSREALEREVRGVRREPGGDVVVVAAFANTREGARKAGELQALVEGVPGLRFERAAPHRAGETWAHQAGLEAKPKDLRVER